MVAAGPAVLRTQINYGHAGSRAGSRPLITPLISFLPYRLCDPFVTAVTV